MLNATMPTSHSRLHPRSRAGNWSKSLKSRELLALFRQSGWVHRWNGGKHPLQVSSPLRPGRWVPVIATGTMGQRSLGNLRREIRAMGLMPPF